MRKRPSPRQCARLAPAIVGISEPSAYRVHEGTGNLLRQVPSAHRSPYALVVFDESREVRTAEEWRKLESQLGEIEQLGNRMANALQGQGATPLFSLFFFELSPQMTDIVL